MSIPEVNYTNGRHSRFEFSCRRQSEISLFPEIPLIRFEKVKNIALVTRTACNCCPKCFQGETNEMLIHMLLWYLSIIYNESAISRRLGIYKPKHSTISRRLPIQGCLIGQLFPENCIFKPKQAAISERLYLYKLKHSTISRRLCLYKPNQSAFPRMLGLHKPKQLVISRRLGLHKH